MADPIFDLRLFHYAMAATEHGSFRKAATALNVQQSSVSRGVRSLENQLGLDLFERGHAGIRPTPAGERFLQEAALGFDHLARAMRRVAALQRGEHGVLTIGLSVPFSLLGDMLEQFRSVYDGVAIEVVEGACKVSCAHVLQRKADIAFVTRAIESDAMRSLHLRDERMIVALPKVHRLAGASAVMLEEVRAERIILSDRGAGPEVADYVTAHTAKSGGEVNVQRHRVGQCDLINMVAQGFGVTIVVGEPKGPTPENVVLIPLAGRHVLSLKAVWQETNSNPALWGLLKILQASATDHRPAHTSGYT